ncbi:hypothetical protein [Lactobacillus mulieris]|nr:hypothetical protein [Lactobacillus mulieris]
MKKFIKLAIVQYDVVIFDGTDEMAKELNLKRDSKGWYAPKRVYTGQESYKYHLKENDLLHWFSDRFNPPAWYYLPKRKDRGPRMNFTREILIAEDEYRNINRHVLPGS